MFKIKNISVCHLYNFSDTLWRNSEQGYNSTKSIMGFVFNDTPQGQGRLFWLWTEYCTICVITGYTLVQLQTYAILGFPEHPWPKIRKVCWANASNVKRIHTFYLRVGSRLKFIFCMYILAYIIFMFKLSILNY